MHTEWMERKFNLIDTPGYADFLSEELSALRVGNFALLVIHAEQGVELGITKAWVPQKESYHCSSQLRSPTAGRGLHAESFSHYEEMPRELEQRVIAESAQRQSNGD